MLERVQMFLTQILGVGGIAGLTLIYLFVIKKTMGDKLKSISWLNQNKLKLFFLAGAPTSFIYAPTLEELIFRAPLIVAFDRMSANAWIGIAISAAAFGLIHLNSPMVYTFLASDLDGQRERGTLSTDDIETEMARIKEEKASKVRVFLWIKVAVMALVGVPLAYYGIRYQSLWVSVGLHAAVNIFSMLILPILIGLVHVLSILFISLVELAGRSFFRLVRHRS